MRKYLLKRLADAYRASERQFPGSSLVRAIGAHVLFVRSVYGVHLFDTPGDRTFELCVSGYGRFISDAIASRTGDFIFLDIGANLGLFSLLAARNRSCRAVIAIEPVPEIFRNLRANITRNRADNVRAVRGAVTGSPEPFVHLAFSPKHSGRAKVVEPGQGTVVARVVPAAELDGLLPKSPMPILVKIDVEGSEADVMQTLKKAAFFSSIDEIIIEISEQHLGAAGRERLLEILAEAGFVEFSRDGPPEHYDARYRRVAPDR
jgi:FkbM family methyltransferase